MIRSLFISVLIADFMAFNPLCINIDEFPQQPVSDQAQPPSTTPMQQFPPYVPAQQPPPYLPQVPMDQYYPAPSGAVYPPQPQQQQSSVRKLS